MSEIDTPTPRRFATRVLPWLIAAGFFCLYLATVNRWISIHSLGVVAQVAGWDGNVPLQMPILWLITRPLLWVIEERQLPFALNVLSAALAAGSLGLLARCVAIFPADRTHEQRIRGQLDGLPMDAPFNWVPPLFAAGLLGFQLTFWEHATVMSGEMLNLFLFAFAARCLAQYRLDERDWRLHQFMFTIGVGCANDWSMLGFVPLFVGALVWTVGWRLLNAKRLVTLLLTLCYGLLLYLLMPMVADTAPGMSESFSTRLIDLLRLQKTQLFAAPRSAPLLLSLILLLPLIFVSIRWQSGGTSGLDQRVKGFFLALLRLLWFLGGIYVAYDLKVNVRNLVPAHPTGSLMTLLTFSWVGALVVGILTGWIVLVGTSSPEKKWEKSASGFSLLMKLMAFACIVGVVAIPASLAWQNRPRLAAQNGPALSQLAAELRKSLPQKPSIILTEDAMLSTLLQADLRLNIPAPDHLLLQTRSAGLSEYRQYIAQKHSKDFPELNTFARSETNVAGIFLRLLYEASREGRAFYLNPVVFDPRSSFILESMRTRPQGLLYALEPYAPGEISPPPLSTPQADQLVNDWNQRMPSLGVITNALLSKANTIDVAARIYSRAANASGVELQRSGRLVDAQRLFGLARNLAPGSATFPGNVAATVNQSVNAALQAKKPIVADTQKILGSLPPLTVVEFFGPVDEPEFLGRLALVLSKTQPPLPRAAAVAASRAIELAPDNVEGAEGYARALLAAGELKLATAAAQNARELAARVSAPPRILAGIELLQARLLAAENNIPAAERILVDALVKYPDEASLVVGTAEIYSSVGRGTNALPYTAQFLTRHKDDVIIRVLRGNLLVEAGQAAEALVLLDAAIANKEDNTDARLGRGMAQLLLEKPSAARRDFEFLLKQNPNFARALLGLGRACLAEGNSGDARRHFQKVVDLTPPGSGLHQFAQLQLQALDKPSPTSP